MGDQPAVLLELLFARSANADASLVPRQVRPQPLEPGHGVLELGELHLEMSFVRPGMSGEDVEDDLGPIHHLDLDGPFQVARLGGSQVVIEDDHVGLVGLDQFL